MSVYVIAQLVVHDPAGYQPYLDGFHPIFERHGGELIGYDPAVEVWEGAWSGERTVIMKFPDEAHAHAWREDPDYKALAEHRHRNARTNLVMVRGQ